MSQKSFHSLNLQNQSQLNPLLEGDSSEVKPASKVSTSKKLFFTSPMFSYFGDSHFYLRRKYSENNKFDFLHSNNFLRKDSLCPNDETKDNEEENGSNSMESEENELEDEEEEEEDDNIENEYDQLTANGVYNQQYINQSQNQTNNTSSSNSKNGMPLFRFNLNEQFNLMTLNQVKQQQRPRFNSGNFTMMNTPNSVGQNYMMNMLAGNNNGMTNNFNNSNNNQKQYSVEMFGRKGWLCRLCNNFNYDTRNKCNRCHGSKSPRKIKKKNYNNVTNINNIENKVNNIPLVFNMNVSQNLNINTQPVNSKVMNNSIQFSERIGDWICFNCKNLNFAFRTVCNRCQLSKEESEAYKVKNNFPLVNGNNQMIDTFNIKN